MKSKPGAGCRVPGAPLLAAFARSGKFSDHKPERVRKITHPVPIGPEPTAVHTGCRCGPAFVTASSNGAQRILI